MRLEIAFLLMLAAAPAVAATCPVNSVFAGCWPDGIGLPTTLPAAQLGESGVEAWSAEQPCLTGCYDFPAGRLVAVGRVNTQGGCVGGVSASDLFTLVGPGSAPVAFEVLLQLETTLPAGGHYIAALYGPGAETAQATDTPNAELVVPLSIVPETPFSVKGDLEAYGDETIQPVASVIASGTIRFRGLPAGYNLVSCQNYNLPTPASPRSWGSVKARYR